MNEIKVQFKHTFPDNMCGAVQSKVRLSSSCHVLTPLPETLSGGCGVIGHWAQLPGSICQGGSGPGVTRQQTLLQNPYYRII